MTNYVHPVTWHKVCSPKYQGRLGLRPLDETTMVMLAKVGNLDIEPISQQFNSSPNIKLTNSQPFIWV